MTQITLHHGDNRVHLRRLIDAGVRVHSVVTDPPYGLTSVTKRFGAANAAPAKFGTDGAFQRAGAGFMGSKWDGTGIERDPEFWKLIHDILLPGGYVVAFSSPRTGHWQACAMETAGFIMHPFLGWLYGSGMPKDHDAAKAIDRQLGVRGEVVPQGDPVKRMIPGADQHRTGSWIKDNGRDYQPGQYVPASDEAAQWDGWAYGAQSLKPALEPIYVGQKPFSEKNGALNLLKHGVGAVHLDACRVEATGEGRPRVGEASQDSRYTDSGSTNFARTPGPRGGDPLGRHPANLLHDGSDDVVALFPHTKSGSLSSDQQIKGGFAGSKHCFGKAERGGNRNFTANEGSAARFFNSFPPSAEDYQWAIDNGIVQPTDGDPVMYQPKATKADRAESRHPTVKPVPLIQWLVRLVTPPGGTVLDPFAGSGTTGEAARREGFDCVLMEGEDQFAADIRRRFNLSDPFLDMLG